MTEQQKYRLLETIPGLLTWGTIVGSIVLSFIKPLWVIYFIILFSLLWVFRVTYFVLFLLLSYRKYKKSIRTKWLSKVKKITDWENHYHAIFLPTYLEPVEVLEQTIEGLLKSDYPSDKMIIILGFEGRVDENIREPKAEYLVKKYSDKFKKILVTVHPDGIVGEIKAKGANAHWMGHRAKECIDDLGIPYEKVIVSYFDCDTVVHQEYFAALTYTYLNHPNPTRSSYQPAVLYSNNIWDSPAAMRITAFSTVFWLFAELMRPDRLHTFSSHSMSFKALVDVGYWQKDIVTDDSRIFLQCFIHYNGEYSVTPIFVPVHMDAVLAPKYADNYLIQYKQMRRWAWGVEHFPYLITQFKKRPKIAFLKKLKYIFNLTEGMYSWATAPVMLFVLGRLPLWVENTYYKDHAESHSFIVQNAPFILEKLMILSMIGIVASALFGLLLLPKRPHYHSIKRSIAMLVQWVLIPVTFVIYGALPAIDAQTRLMLNKPLGFFVTPKDRK